MPLRVAGTFRHCAWRAAGLPLRVAAARNRSDWFPAPSSGQALCPAPIMIVGGSLMLGGHASAAVDK
jgi:hypothetical protein